DADAQRGHLPGRHHPRELRIGAGVADLNVDLDAHLVDREQDFFARLIDRGLRTIAEKAAAGLRRGRQKRRREECRTKRDDSFHDQPPAPPFSNAAARVAYWKCWESLVAGSVR